MPSSADAVQCLQIFCFSVQCADKILALWCARSAVKISQQHLYSGSGYGYLNLDSLWPTGNLQTVANYIISVYVCFFFLWLFCTKTLFWFYTLSLHKFWIILPCCVKFPQQNLYYSRNFVRVFRLCALFLLFIFVFAVYLCLISASRGQPTWRPYMVIFAVSWFGFCSFAVFIIFVHALFDTKCVVVLVLNHSK